MSKLSNEDLNQLEQFYQIKGLKSYSFNPIARQDKIQYGEYDYDFFTVREVLREGIQTGEFHIKLKDQSNINSAVLFFKKNLPSEEVGLIDPENILNLDYPIFLIINNTLLRTSILDIFHDMNEELKTK